MLPGNVDPRRPEKVQRYKSPATNGNGQGEDLTPDYMNILGQRATTANAATAVEDKQQQQHQQQHVDNSGSNVELNRQVEELVPTGVGEETVLLAVSSDATNVIPTSPQYGVAIIPNNTVGTDLPTETLTPSTDSVIDTTVKSIEDSTKDLHSTPSRNDRFKVVKIASLEPFKRGRWKCMDYVDEAPPPVTQPTKVPQSSGNIQVAGGVYLQTQSLPQQQIQQMLLQSGYTNGTQFFQPTQIMPQTQYFYPQQTQVPQQIVNQTGVPSSMPAQFIQTAQPFFSTGVVQNSQGFTIPANYQNVQYVPNIIQNQNSAFVPTSQTLPTNFQQSQTYAGPPNQPLVNGHAYQSEQQQQQQQQQQQVTASLPTQTAKSVILNSNQQSVVSQPLTNQSIQNQVPVINQQYQQQNSFPQQQQQHQQPPQQQSQTNQQILQNVQVPPPQQQQQVVSVPTTFDQTNKVYSNPQFDTNVSSLTALENTDVTTSSEVANEGGTDGTTDTANDDPSKTNAVNAVNAIDNKIEQAMDLVKSHLMYTVREEVEVLKEKIAELMDKIQQLENENNYLRSQIPKNQILNLPPLSTANPVSTNVTTTTSSTTSNSTTGSTNDSQQQQ